MSFAFPLFSTAADLTVALLVLVLLGVVMAFSPTRFAVEVSILRTSDHRGRDVWIIAGATAAGALLLGAVLLAFSPESVDSVWQGRVKELLLQRTLDGIAGVVLVVAGIWQWFRARTPRAPRVKVQRSFDRPRILAGIIVAETVLSTTSVATMYLTTRTVSGAAVSWSVRLAAYAVFLAAVALPYLALGWCWLRFPAVDARIGAWTDRLAERDWRRPTAVVLVAVGAFLLVAALTGYFGHD